MSGHECGTSAENARLRAELAKLRQELEAREPRPAWWQSRDGQAIDLGDPDVSGLAPAAIADQLAGINRFNAATRFYYSVAQHLVLGARQFADRDMAFAFLMHDAHEAVTGDVSAPMKRAIGWACERVEERIMRAFAWRWRIPFPHPEEVKRMDLRMCWTEHVELQAKEPRPWGIPEDPVDVAIVEWTPEEAARAWLLSYEGLGGPAREQK